MNFCSPIPLKPITNALMLVVFLTCLMVVNPVQAASLPFKYITGAYNPFNGIDVGYYSRLSLADIDNDGDLDAFIGEFDGGINFYRDVGSATAPSFSLVTGSSNPLNGVSFGQGTAPTLADIDGDGDLDALIGASVGDIHFYRNNGTASSPSFSVVTGSGNPFNGVDVGDFSILALADIDGDGDLDAFVGESNGNINYYWNAGTATNPFFTEVSGSSNPFNGVTMAGDSTITLGDMDGDGDLDAFIGESAGHVHYYRNDGSVNAPSFAEMTDDDNPLDSVYLSFNAPLLTDIDDDGDLDALIGDFDGAIEFYRNDVWENYLPVLIK
jgi:hypothetical protein